MKTDYVVTIDEHLVTVKFANETHTVGETSVCAVAHCLPSTCDKTLTLNVSLLSVTLAHEQNDIGEIIAVALFELEQKVDDLVRQSLMEYQSDDY